MNARINDLGDITLPSQAPHLHAVPTPSADSETPVLPIPGVDLRAALEGILFVQNQAMPLEKLAELLGMDTDPCQELIRTVKEAYDADSTRGLQIIINDLGIQLATKAQISSYIQRLDGQRVTSLSIPALETLSVIAFKQPITKAEVEAVRGVNCDGVISTLLEKKLIYVSGEKQVIGRPRLYSTTQDFLYYFGIKSLKHLPVPVVEMPESESLKEIQDQLGGNAPDLPDNGASAPIPLFPNDRVLDAGSVEELPMESMAGDEFPADDEKNSELSAREPSGELPSEPISESDTGNHPEKSGGDPTGEGGSA